MKKVLFGLPTVAIIAAVVVLVGQAANGSTVSAVTAPESNLAKVAATTSAVVSDNPAVIMQDWQETARKTRGSRYCP